MEKKEGKRMVDVHHLGAEKSGATRPSQARPEARLWLRDHLGRQAWSAEEVKGAGGRTDRRENHRRAKKNGEEDPRGTSRDEGRRSSIVMSSFEPWNRIGRHCGRRKRGNQRRGPSRLHSSGTRVFKHGYPRECRSTTDRITRTHVRPYKLQDLLFLSLSYSCFSSFRLYNLFGTIPSHNVLLPLMPTPSHAYTDTNPQNPLAPLHHRVVRFSSPLTATRTARRPSWRHPVWQDRPTDKGGGAWPLRCHVLGLRAAPTFGLKDKSDERVSRRGVLRRLPVCYCYASYRYS